MALQEIPINKTSSNIKSIFHDTETLDLIVEFHNGGQYQYSQVPIDVAAGFTTADSLGKYLHNNIKSQYETKRL